jgi:predicted outer membrane repeat protein
MVPNTRAMKSQIRSRRSARRNPARARAAFNQPRLALEPLEARRLLALVTIDTLADAVDAGDGVTSLREAILATNQAAGPDEIDFAASLTSPGGPATILLTQGELAITDSLTITGPGADLLTLDASGNDPTPDSNNGDGSRVLNIDDANAANLLDVSIGGLALAGGDFVTGGAILSSENLAVTASRIVGNSAASGGGIYASGATLTIVSSTISGNSASGRGGGIRTFAILTITDSTITGNSAALFGGGIYKSGSGFTVTNSIISSNSALGGSGGGTRATGRLTLIDSTISGNSATGSGGGIFGSATITNSTISGNSATGSGGGIFGSGTISNSTISGNSAGFHGGGIYGGGTILGPIPKPWLASRRCRRIADGRRPSNCRFSFPSAQAVAARGSSRSGWLRPPIVGLVVRRGEALGFRLCAGCGECSHGVAPGFPWACRSRPCPNRGVAFAVRSAVDERRASTAAWPAATWHRERWRLRRPRPGARRGRRSAPSA